MTTQNVDDTFLPRRAEEISPVQQVANNEAVLTNDNPTIPRFKVDEREVSEPTPEPMPDAGDEIRRLHEESERLLAVIDRPLGFPSHRRKLQAALQAEGDALRKAGFHSYTEFLAGTAPSTVLESSSPDPPLEAAPAFEQQPVEPVEGETDPDAPEPVLDNERVSALEADLLDARAGLEAASAEIAVSKSEIRRLASELELARSDLAAALAPPPLPPPPSAQPAAAPANDRRVGLESDLFALEQRLIRTRAKRQRIKEEIADERRHLGRERQAADQEVALARQTVERLRRSSALEAKAVEEQAEKIASALTEAAIDEADAIVAIATSEANRRRQLADSHAGRATRKIETVKARLELLRFETVELSRVLSEMLAEIITDLGPTDKRDD